MSEKQIITYLIEAFNFAKNHLIEECGYRCGNKGICVFIDHYLRRAFIFDGHFYYDYFDVINNYFLDFFDAEKFGLDFMYSYRMGKIAMQYKVCELSFEQRKSFFWFPLEAQYVEKRIEICDKAINMLNEKLKQLS